jgi:nitrile hydratase
MNGMHDLGGMDGFGAVIVEKDEPVFHSDWERRMYGIASVIAYPLDFNDDQFRREIERVPPPKYLNSSYYELWFFGILGILKERGITSLEEIDVFEPSGVFPPFKDGVVTSAMVEDTILAGASTRADVAEIPQEFSVGDIVRVRNNHPYHHHRAPRYIRGRLGKIVIDHGVFNFADSNSEYRGEQPQHCYSVEFSGSELWGEDAEDGSSVTIDLFETYIEAT